MTRLFLVVAAFSLWLSIGEAQYPPGWNPPTNPGIPPTRNYGPPPQALRPLYIPPQDPCGGVSFEGAPPAISWVDLVEVFSHSSKATLEDLRIGKKFRCYIMSRVSKTYRDYNYGTNYDSTRPDRTFRYDNSLCPATFSVLPEPGTKQLIAEANGSKRQSGFGNISESSTALNFIYGVSGLRFPQVREGQELQATWFRREPRFNDAADLTVRVNKDGLSLYYRGENHYAYQGYFGTEQEITTTGLEGLAVCWDGASPPVIPHEPTTDASH